MRIQKDREKRMRENRNGFEIKLEPGLYVIGVPEIGYRSNAEEPLNKGILKESCLV